MTANGICPANVFFTILYAKCINGPGTRLRSRQFSAFTFTLTNACMKKSVSIGGMTSMPCSVSQVVKSFLCERVEL